MEKQNLKNIVCIVVIALLLTIAGAVEFQEKIDVTLSENETQNSESLKCSVLTKNVHY